jgi:competence protein ComEA
MATRAVQRAWSTRLVRLEGTQSMMGQSPAHTTQATTEGSDAPLGARSSTWKVWKPVLRRVVAVTLGGLGLAGIGALSMARPTGNTDSVPSAPPALAGMLAPTEWLATGTPSLDATKPPPCPPASTAEPSPEAAASRSSPTSNPAAVLPDGRIVLNLATPTELTKLPGIGQKRAEAIVALRTKLRGFRKLSDLLRVKGIGVKSLKKLEPKLVLDVPAPLG